MDLLENENGFSILETMVVIVIIALVVVFTTSFINLLMTRTSFQLKNNASMMMDEEIDRTIKLKLLNDTVYADKNKQLQLTKKIALKDKAAAIEIFIHTIPSNKPIMHEKFELLR